jgi:plasmid maintenance system antidote protein VapI
VVEQESVSLILEEFSDLKKLLKSDLARLLSISEAKLSELVSRADKEDRERRNRAIFDMWMGCYTQEEIGDREGLSQPQVKEILSEFSDVKKLIKSDLARAEHAVDFEVPIYNVWKQQEKTRGSEHFGNTEVRWLDNLLYLYTQPFEIVEKVGMTQQAVAKVLQPNESFRFVVKPGEWEEITDEGERLAEIEQPNRAVADFQTDFALFPYNIWKQQERSAIFEMWMACHTQEDIAEKVAVHKDSVSEICRKMADLPESDKPVAAHLTDFDVPLYNVWKQQEKTRGSEHFGNSEVRWLASLLEHLTEAELREIELEENENRKSFTERERTRTFASSKRIVVGAKQAAEIISTQSVEKDPRGRKSVHGAPKDEIAGAIGISTTALVKAEQHVKTAEQFPFMQGNSWKQSDVLRVRERFSWVARDVFEIGRYLTEGGSTGSSWIGSNGSSDGRGLLPNAS